MFEVVTGMGPGEYIRKRRLSLAALDLEIVSCILGLGDFARKPFVLFIVENVR
jgi:hypothetical protein